MVFHSGSHTTPHTLIDLGIHAIMLWTQTGEIHISSGMGILCGKNMVKHSLLVKIGITCVLIICKQIFRQLHHIIGVTAFRTIGMVDILRTT